MPSKTDETSHKTATGKKEAVGRETVVNFPVVGIGASAGGLEAFEDFFTHIPSDTGMAFIVIQHLDPTGGGLLPDLLTRFTRMRVVEVQGTTVIEPNTVYVIPPNRDLSTEHGTLSLHEPQSLRGIRMPIDFFFRHLAEDQGDNAYGIILSGTGTDGTLGVKAIKENLGVVMVQDPTTASFGGMSQSAIETGLVDYIGPAEELPKKLVTYATNAASALAPTITDKTLETVQQILGVLRSRTGHDFTGLKQNMLVRRIQRRRDMLELPSLQEYLAYVQKNELEAQLLYKELLIGVTNFFRDAEAWVYLKHAMEEELLKATPEKALRIWDVGCSTGEEAYSLAITLVESLEEAGLRDKVEFQIFASDIDADAIDIARQGKYYPNIALDVNAERLSRFFVKEGPNYRVKKDIRERIVFAVQDVVRDPPFTKLDLLVCRNLLIYFISELQRRLVPIFHYSLNPGGILFLGSSETVGKQEEYFSAYNSKWKIYINKPETGEAELETAFPVYAFEHMREAERKEYLPPTLRDVVQHQLLSAYAPAALVVNKDGDIVYFFGKTGKYLEPATGKASLNIHTLASEPLRLELSNAIFRAARTENEVVVKGLKFVENGISHLLDLRVRSLNNTAALRDLLLVTFEERAEPEVVVKKVRRKTQSERERLLDDEVTTLKDRLQSAIEEMETSREEFKSTMEELQSTNEELQSTNEELKTSREELQSVNEELVTVNSELKQKNDELAVANSDLQNLLESTQIATLFVDTKVRIMRFTSAITRILNLIPADVGRPLSDISSNLEDSTLVSDIKNVLKSHDMRERHVTTKDGTKFHVRVRPYLTLDKAVAGAVVTFADVKTEKEMAP